MQISDISREIHANTIQKGWWETVGEMLMLIVSECSAALEEWRDGRIPGEIYYNKNSMKPEGIDIELADIAIRLFDLAEGLDIDLETAIMLKHKYNCTRSYRHGNKLA